MKAKDLAKKLGVSPATISLVLNNKPGISESLRSSLLEKIRELNCEEMMCEACREGEAPGADREKREREAIVYLSYLECDEWEDRNGFFPGVLEGAESEARHRGFSFSVFHMLCQQEPLEKILNYCGKVRGIIIQSENITERIKNDLQNVDIPSVFMDIYDPKVNVSSVRVDNLESMHTVVSYLKEKGHRRIGYVYSGWETGWQHNRFFSFRSAMDRNGLEFDQKMAFKAGTGEDLYEFQRLSEIFANTPELPTALVCENDRQALRAINALEQNGLKVPKDVSVVGFDGSAISNIVRPKLTTMRNSSQLMGRECVMLLENLNRLRELESPAPQLKYDISARMIERDSVRDLNEPWQEK